MSTDNEFDYTAVKEALATLEREGRKLFKEEYRDKADYYESVGQAIANCDDTMFPENIARLAYAIFEDWNCHSTCAMLDWIYPRMYNCGWHTGDLDRLKALIGDRTITVFTTWNKERGQYNTATCRVRLSVKEVK